ncbi:hypothetical protein LTR37_012273 [Vermiconidia calcicola]|uniref:Uncharacterized protein n=1 Tax=Vermiconidia calcicola TaxID=1690605 RepID=A0ACC3N094_9PEZI|nr:hypothetical protein LTR37_012273 [Vermiconidia calcicola]
MFLNVSPETTPHGLDRAPLDTHIPLDPNQKASKGRSEQHGSSKRRRLSKLLPSKLQRKVDDHVARTCGDESPPEAGTVMAPVIAPAPATDNQNDRFSGKAKQESKLPPLKEFINIPVDTVKGLVHKRGEDEFAENMANPEISHGASVNLVLAHEKMEASTDHQEREQTQQDFAALKASRQASFIRWTMDRHVRKVKNVQAQQVTWHGRREFVQTEGGKKKMHWLYYGHNVLQYNLSRHSGRYIGASSELPEPTQQALIAGVERALLTSTPAQSLTIKLMTIAYWENPKVTGAYAAVYCVLCMLNYIPRAVILYVVYATLRARYYPPTIPELRQKLERAEDEQARAQDITELIEQHGSRGWVSALIERQGPTTQLQLEDFANLMERLKNFYEWRDPRRTTFSLATMLLLWLIITFTPLWLLVKAFFFYVGLLFFVVLPISYHWPNYRLLVSPWTWLLWKVPTHGEWAIDRLQAEAAQRLPKQTPHATSPTAGSDTGEPAIGPSPDPQKPQPATPPEEEAPRESLRINRYRCIYRSMRGNLYLDADSLRFEMPIVSTEKWRLSYAKLKSMQKVIGSDSISSGEDIIFIDVEDKEYRVSALTVRDEVFTQIIAYSNIEWQIAG